MSTLELMPSSEVVEVEGEGGEWIERAKWESLLEAETATGEIKVAQTVELVGWRKSLSKKDEHERKDGREELE